MAHRIQDNMISWKGEKPWHGLGTQVNPDASGLDMLRSAKMDWIVQRRVLAMRGLLPNGEVDRSTMLTAELDAYRAIVRADTNEVFQIATKRYKPVQNAEIVEFFKAFCDAGHARIETVGAIDGGRKVWCLAKLNHGGDSDKMIGGVDEAKGYILLATSHDGSLRTIAKTTGVYVVCWNTLSAAVFDEKGRPTGEFMLKHSAKFDNAAKQRAMSLLGMATEGLQAQYEAAEVLSKVRVDDKGRAEFVRTLLGDDNADKGLLDEVVTSHESTGVLDRILNASETPADQDREFQRLGKALIDAMLDSPGANLPSRRHTLWGAVNGVTWHVDHDRGRTTDSTLKGAWFGDGDRMKRDALKIGLQMAGVSVPGVNARMS